MLSPSEIETRLIKLMEKRRSELNKLGAAGSLISPTIIRKSKQLDKLVNIYNRNKKKEQPIA